MKEDLLVFYVGLQTPLSKPPIARFNTCAVNYFYYFSMLWIADETYAWNMPIWQAGGACNLGSHELTDECSGV
jgi:hypothetical protein